MKYYKQILLILFALCAASLLYAQDTYRSLDECMEYAIANSSRVRIREWNIRNQREDLKAAKGSFLPSVNGSVGANANFGRSIDPETNTYSNTSNFSNGYDISGSIPLFQSGALLSNLKLNKLIVSMGLQEKAKTEFETAVTTMQAYADASYYDASLKLAEDKLLQSNHLLQKTIRMEELGIKSAADVAQVSSEVAADEYNVIKQQNLYEQAILSLKEVMNYPLTDPLLIKTQTVDSIEYAAVDPESLYERARNWTPQTQIYALRLKQAERQIVISRSKLLPSLYLNGGINTRYFENLKSETSVASFGSQLKNNLGEWVGITLNIPLFNGLSRSSTLNKAKNQHRIAREEFEESERALRIEIDKLIHDCEGLRKELMQIQKKIKADELAYEVTVKKYEKGLLSIYDLQVSTNNLLQSRINKLQTELNFMMKKRIANYYDGKPLIRK